MERVDVEGHSRLLQALQLRKPASTHESLPRETPNLKGEASYLSIHHCLGFAPIFSSQVTADVDTARCI